MTDIIVALLIGLAVAGLLLATFAAAYARRVEARVPPQGRVATLGGAALHVFDAGAGPPIVMIHGLAGQVGNFSHSLIDRLTGEFRVVAIDRPGSGYSPRPAGASASLTAQAATLAGAIRALKLDRPLVVGHSLGGAVALALALDHPDCVGALALISPLTQPLREAPAPFRGLAIRVSWLRRLVAWTGAAPYGVLAGPRLVRTVFAPETPPADFDSVGGGGLNNRPAAFIANSLDLIAAETDMAPLVARYPTLALPVGILFGRGDVILDYRLHGEKTRSMIAGLELTLVEGGHMLPVTIPDRVAEWLRAMARRRDAALEAASQTAAPAH